MSNGDDQLAKVADVDISILYVVEKSLNVEISIV